MDLFKDFSEEEIRLLTKPSRGWGKGSWRDGISHEEYLKICERVSEGKRKGWARIKSSPDRYLEMLRINSEAQKEYWENLSPKDREEACFEFRSRIDRWRSNLSKEEYESFYKDLSKTMRDYWDGLSPEVKECKLRNSFLRGSGKQTEPEVMVGRWLDRNKPGEYKYNGISREVIIGGKVPDFINVNGKKEVVEVWGSYWHLMDNPDDLKAHYKKYGFDCKVIWEFECYDSEEIERILA